MGDGRVAVAHASHAMHGRSFPNTTPQDWRRAVEWILEDIDPFIRRFCEGALEKLARYGE
jgi:hypothetical protein